MSCSVDPADQHADLRGDAHASFHPPCPAPGGPPCTCPRARRGGLDLARSRRSPSALQLRPRPPVPRWTAPWHRRRGRRRGTCRRACRRQRDVRGHGAGLGEERHDRDPGWRLGHAHPPRLADGCPGGDGRRGRGCGVDRPERRPRGARAVCASRHPDRLRSGGVPRSVVASPGAPRPSCRARSRARRSGSRSRATLARRCARADPGSGVSTAVRGSGLRAVAASAWRRLPTRCLPTRCLPTRRLPTQRPPTQGFSSRVLPTRVLPTQILPTHDRSHARCGSGLGCGRDAGRRRRDASRAADHLGTCRTRARQSRHEHDRPEGRGRAVECTWRGRSRLVRGWSPSSPTHGGRPDARTDADGGLPSTCPRARRSCSQVASVGRTRSSAGAILDAGRRSKTSRGGVAGTVPRSDGRATVRAWTDGRVGCAVHARVPRRACVVPCPPCFQKPSPGRSYDCGRCQRRGRSS